MVALARGVLLVGILMTVLDAQIVTAQIAEPGTGVGESMPLVLSRSAIVGRNLPPIVDPGTGVALRGSNPPVIIVDPVAGVARRLDPAIAAGATIGQSTTPMQFTLPQRPPVIVDPGIGVAGTVTARSVAGEHETVDPDEGPARPGVPPLSFMDLDSGLRDCNIPFDELKKESPFCKGQPNLADGRRCERFSYSQFPEVVMIAVAVRSGNDSRICTGTMIARDWVATAAHCFLWNSPTADFTESRQASSSDLIWTAASSGLPFSGASVEARNAKMLSYAERIRYADRIVVFGKYGGNHATPPYSNDLAVIHLSRPYPRRALEPASLATEEQASAEVTIAGYGYSNADGGTFQRFNVTWPVGRVSRNMGLMSFNPVSSAPIQSSFCSGDSGGPVFAGRVRGCKAYDMPPKQAETRPRRLQGIISYMREGVGVPYTSEALERSSECRNSHEMNMQDITVAERRNWICRVTGNAPEGC